LNEKRIQQVLEIEKQAQAIYEQAISEAEQLPLLAEKEVQLLIEKARADATEEARQMIARAQSQDESAQILADADEKVRRTETLAAGNLDRAVAYVLARVIGRE
jgi:vacuolar-type H+-ATPase subunit H